MKLVSDFMEYDDNDESAHSSLLNDIKKLDGNNLRFGEEKETRIISDTSAVTVTDDKKLSEILSDRKLVKKRKTLKTLEKPIEKPAAKRLKRAIGYQEVAEDVNKWEGITNANRRAEQVKFPLHKQDLRVKTSIENSRIVARTDLEKNIYSKLYGESMTAPISKAEIEKVKTMSLKEVTLRSKELWEQKKLRERLERKAARKNKSKSRKFHRIQKREKLRKGKEEFNKLKLTDPEAALEKLEEIEQSRIEERMSQRHRSSKWLHLQNNRAGHDSLARQVISETKDLAKELLEKYKKEVTIDNEIEEEDEDSDTNEILKNQQRALQRGGIDPSNPWASQLARLPEKESPPANLLKLNKYWEEQNNKKRKDNIANKIADQNLEKTGMKSIVPENENSNDEDYTDIEDEEPAEKKMVIKKKSKNLKKKSKKVTKKSDTQENSYDEDERAVKTNGNKKTNSKKIKNLKKKSKKTTKKSDSVEDSNADDYTDIEDEGTPMKTMVNKKSKKIKNLKKKSKKTTKKSDSVEDYTDIEDEGTPVKTMVNKKIKKIKNLKKKSQKTINKSDIDEVPVTETKVKKLKKQTIKLTKDIKAKTTKKMKIKTKISDNVEVKSRIGMEQKDESNFVDNLFKDTEHMLLDACNNKYEKMEMQENKQKKDIQKKFENNKRTRNTKKNIEYETLFSNVCEEEFCEEGPSRARTLDDLEKLLEKNTEEKAKTPSLNDNNDNIKPDAIEMQPDESIDEKKITINARCLKSAPSFEKFGVNDMIDNSDDEALDAGLEDDTVFEEFQEIKAKKEAEEKKKLMGKGPLKGWGSWVGPGIKEKKIPKQRHLSTKPYEKPQSKHWKPHVIYNQKADLHSGIRSRMVSEVPYPFTSNKDFEASIRQPITRLFVPEIAHRKLITKPVVTKMGTVIKPMDEEMLVTKMNQKNLMKRLDNLKSKNRKLKNKNKHVKSGMNLVN